MVGALANTRTCDFWHRCLIYASSLDFFTMAVAARFCFGPDGHDPLHSEPPLLQEIAMQLEGLVPLDSTNPATWLAWRYAEPWTPENCGRAFSSGEATGSAGKVGCGA